MLPWIWELGKLIYCLWAQKLVHLQWKEVCGFIKRAIDLPSKLAITLLGI